MVESVSIAVTALNGIEIRRAFRVFCTERGRKKKRGSNDTLAIKAKRTFHDSMCVFFLVVAVVVGVAVAVAVVTSSIADVEC